jgi:anti-sigma-K factor RskA
VRRWRSEAHLLTGGYALDALEPAEHRAFERHLVRCGPCVTEVRGLRETAARLAYAAAVPPPFAMRERVMAASYQVRQLPPAPTAPTALPAPSAMPAPNAMPTPSAMPTPRAPRWRIAAAVALAAVALLAVLQLRTQHLLDTTRAGNGQVAAVLGAPDVSARSGSVSGGGTLTVVASGARHEAVITASGMPSLPVTEVYQLWLLGPAGATSAGLLPTERDGRTDPLLASGIGPGDRLGLTIEPTGGTTHPTTAPLIVLPLPTS